MPTLSLLVPHYLSLCCLIQALRQELAHASYLNMTTVILPPPRYRAHVADYARAVNSCLINTGLSQFMQFSVRLPIYVPSQAIVQAVTGSPSKSASSIRPISPSSQSTAPSEIDLIATWEMWDAIRTICNYNTRLSLSKLLRIFLIE